MSGGSATVWASVVALASLGAICGCQAKILTPNERDPLRREIAAKDEEIRALKAQVGELQTALAAAQGSAAGTVDPDSAPLISGIRLGRQTGIDPDHPDVLRVWVEPFDGRQRFVQFAGTVTILANWPGGGGRTEASFTPAQVRDAWRSGFMGAAYAFAVPLAPDANRPRHGAEGLELSVHVALAGSDRNLTASIPEPGTSASIGDNPTP